MRITQPKRYLAWMAWICSITMHQVVWAQSTLLKDSISIEEVIRYAKKQSIDSQIATNAYIMDYWNYLNHKKAHYPMVTLTSNPIQYVQKIIKRYDSQNNLEVYKPQRTIYSSIGLAVKQRVNATGGDLFLETNLDYMRNYGSERLQQFSAVPIRIGYSQELLGFNPYKWEKKIEKKKFDKARKQITSELERISAETVRLFFAYLAASEQVKIAFENCKKCDSTYSFALERMKIGAMTQTEILTLKLNLVDAQKEHRLLTISQEEAKKNLLNFLNIHEEMNLNFKLPLPQKTLLISPEKALYLARMNHPLYEDMEMKKMDAELSVNRNKRTNISSTLSLSLGFNQTADNFWDAYHRPLRQDLVSISLNMPIFDWGIRKRTKAIAKKNLESTLLAIEQEKENFEESLYFLVEKFNESYRQIELASEALNISRITFESTYERFRIGKTNVELLKISQDRMMSARLNYINAISSYWNTLYEIRSLTLYDFMESSHIEIDVEQYIR